MVTGHLRERNNMYYIVLNYIDWQGKRHSPSKATGLTVKGNKKRAEKMLQEARKELEDRLKKSQPTDDGLPYDPRVDILFTAFLEEWLAMTRRSVEESTFAAYNFTIKHKIVPYFTEHHPGLLLRDVKPKHIQDYYTYEMEENGVSANTVIHRHANIRKAMQHAFKLGLIDVNPADRVERPKKEHFRGSIYNEAELKELFRLVKGDPLELGVLFGAYYGLRRSEVVGLKWDAIDFEKKTITIQHTVTHAYVDGKRQLVEKDRAKTKSSLRTLPLIPAFEERLREEKRKQAANRKLCGSAYNKDYLGYVYVNELGDLISPSFLTQHFPIFLKNNGLRRIRFHDLRHPYVKHTTKNISCKSRNPKPSNILRWSGIPAFSITEGAGSQSNRSWTLYAISMRLPGNT